ncbi:MAG: hypothetical protein KDM81_05765 [Verrucomicrobiae bacterium]|nr:hypothetical protein [Verrucomicrobiae bacterium]
MKTIVRSCVVVASLMAIGAPGLWGQSVTGTVDSNGLTARADTFYVNDLNTSLNNLNTEALGVAITAAGDIVIGWEDDGDGLSDLEAVWALYSAGGVPITGDADIASNRGGSITMRYRSFFRANGSPTPANTAWGPKIKANLFGNGFGMGATAFDLRYEVPEVADIEVDAGGGGDWPALQLLDNTGDPLGLVSGVSAAEAEPAGDIRIADWDYLANGNLVVVGESRQEADLVSKYGGAAAGKHAIFRIVTPAGEVVKAATLVSETAVANEIWHGVGVTANGFGVRFWQGGKTFVRLFDNAGEPVTGNLDLGTLTGNAAAAAGGRGDSAGFHGNGVDAYVAISAGTTAQGAWVTVLNADGTVRYSRSASDDVPLTALGSVDAAIDPAGRVLAVWEGQDSTDWAAVCPLIMGRLLKADGTPVDQTFYVSELETPELAYFPSSGPRVTCLHDSFAVVWESQSAVASIPTVAGRLFGIAHKPGSIESVGLTRIVPDTPVIVPQLASLGNWEPYASVVGNSAFLIECNTFAEGTTDKQRYVVMLQPVAGGTPRMVEGFYADNGQPFAGIINASRQNGNPGRVAGDVRPGAVNYLVGGEASPHVYSQFQSDNRWNLGFNRLADGRYAVVQGYSLDLATLTPTPLCKALDAINGRLTSGTAGGNQIGRFGGDLVALDNGNFVATVDDRSGVREAGNITTAVILAPDGSIVKESFVVASQDIWSNLAAFRGGFCARVHQNLYFYDNAGNLQGMIDQATSGSQFDTGRGDGTRIAGHVNSPYVYLAGKVSDANVVKVAVWDAQTRAFVTQAEVSEAGFAGDFDRATLAVDALNRVVVSWVSKPPGYEQQQVAARVMAFDPDAGTITPLTASFLPFVNAAETGGIRTLQMSLAMTTKQIMVAAKGEINLQNLPDNGANSPSEINFYTVISHPNPQDDPTPPVGGFPEFTGIQRNPDGSVTIEWTGGGTLEAATSVDGPWQAVSGATSPHTLQPSGPSWFGRVKK